MSNDALLEKVLSTSTGGAIAWNRLYDQARVEKLRIIQRILKPGSGAHSSRGLSAGERDDLLRKIEASLREIEER